MEQSASLSVEMVFLESQLPWKPPRFRDSVMLPVRFAPPALRGLTNLVLYLFLKIKVLTSWTNGRRLLLAHYYV